MSGIAGILWHGRRPQDDDPLPRVLDRLVRRGPDGRALWADDCLSLGRTHLNSLPEAHLETIHAIEAGGGDRCVRISGDCRLDNREELLSRLAIPRDPSQVPDSMIALESYLRWGDDFPRRLTGDFALAIWDQRDRRLRLARDRFGIKPLFHCRTPRFFAFASDIHALLCLPGVDGEPNERRMAELVLNEMNPAGLRETSIAGIHRLLPARLAIVTDQKLIEQRYWTLTAPPPLRLSSDAEYEEAFREQFDRAVRLRLRAAPGKVGSMLSGGLDSSSIVAASKKLLTGQSPRPLAGLHTFSAVDTGLAAGRVETEAIRAVVATGGIEQHSISPSQLVATAGTMAAFLSNGGTPGSAAKIVAPIPSYALAKANGVNAVMDGVDGDLVTSVGAAYIKFLIKNGQFRDAWKEARGWENFHRCAGSQGAWISVLGRSFCSALLPSSARSLRHVAGRRRRLAQFQSYLEVLDPAFVRRIDLEARFREHDARVPTAPSSLAEHCLALIDDSQMLDIMEDYDAAAAYYSVEPRRPFFDQHFLQFCLQLPWDQRIRDGFSKRLLRRTFREELPGPLLARRNFEHVGPAFSQEWLEHEWARTPPQPEMNNRLTRIFRESFVTKQFDAFGSGARDDATRLNTFSLTAFALWLGNLERDND